jgi:hypothetical protein
MVEKIATYETAGRDLRGRAVLVADNPDDAGDFVADAEEIASTLLAGRDLRQIYLSDLGVTETRRAIVEAFNEGASLMSYIGHGAVHLWANENLFSVYEVGSLSPQTEQPLLLTMNCLNGFFHMPNFDSLAEKLLKAEGKGVIAAFSASGLSLDSAAHLYHKALVRELFDGGHQRLGEAVLAAQAVYADTGALDELLAIYHLFGDPAMSLR